MICNIVIAALLHFIAAEAASDGTYVFHLRRTEFVDTEVLRRVLSGVDWKVVALCNMMEVDNRFAKAVEEFESVTSSASRQCVTYQDRTAVQDARSGFQTAREECVKKADCKSRLAEAVEKAVTNLQSIDTAAFKEVEACGSDDACKYKAYNNTHVALVGMYVRARPRLRLLSDQAVSSDNCAGAIVKCMVERNEAALRSLYTGIQRVSECGESLNTAYYPIMYNGPTNNNVYVNNRPYVAPSSGAFHNNRPEMAKLASPETYPEEDYY